ncbi:MAG TPA: class I SAM-dependent methyltransferase [Pseudonocardiaceae bacterium]|jgi:SAM-dependent methyltransferase|nr:class I SAM-dependent methyltransferase [Pseudonocardiaceae bacterium]
MDNHSGRALSFGKQASLYERLRPGYPAEAVEAFLPEPGRRVVDVGAGTGKLTATLLAAGHTVTAVEPDPDMRAVLAEGAPDVDVLDGTGEALPLPDGSADAICYGQSWHWVEPEAGAHEARRVLTEDGVLALLWNIPDTRQQWVKELYQLSHPGEDPLRELRPMTLSGFAPGAMVRTDWRQRLARPEVVDLFSTFSRIATSPPAQRAALLDGVHEIVTTHPDVADATEVELPYVCVALHYRIG